MKGRFVALISAFSILLTGCAAGTERLVQRPNPEIEVSAGEFESELGFHLSIPEGAGEVTYTIDTESKRGLAAFYQDGVLWNALVMRSDVSIDFINYYDDDNVDEVDIDFDSNQVLKVRGADPVLKYYRMRYSDNSEAYMLTAQWFLEDEGFMVALKNYSEEPVHTMPVEVFG